MNPIFTKQFIADLQNFETCEQFNALSNKGNLKLGVKGDRLVVVQQSSNIFVRFFQAIANFFSRISTNQEKVGKLCLSTSDRLEKMTIKQLDLLETVCGLNERSKAAKFADMRKFADMGWAKAEEAKQRQGIFKGMTNLVGLT